MIDDSNIQDISTMIKFLLTLMCCLISFLFGFLYGNYEAITNMVQTYNSYPKENICSNITNLNTTKIEINNNSCKYEVLIKEYEMYKIQTQLEFDIYKACKEGMLK